MDAEHHRLRAEHRARLRGAAHVRLDRQIGPIARPLVLALVLVLVAGSVASAHDERFSTSKRGDQAERGSVGGGCRRGGPREGRAASGRRARAHRGPVPGVESRHRHLPARVPEGRDQRQRRWRPKRGRWSRSTRPRDDRPEVHLLRATALPVPFDLRGGERSALLGALLHRHQEPPVGAHRLVGGRAEDLLQVRPVSSST